MALCTGHAARRSHVVGRELFLARGGGEDANQSDTLCGRTTRRSGWALIYCSLRFVSKAHLVMGADSRRIPSCCWNYPILVCISRVTTIRRYAETKCRDFNI